MNVNELFNLAKKVSNEQRISTSKYQSDIENGLFGEVDENTLVIGEYYLLNDFDRLVLKSVCAFRELQDNPLIENPNRNYHKYISFKIRLHFSKDYTRLLKKPNGYSEFIKKFSDRLSKLKYNKPLNLKFIDLPDGTKILIGSVDHPCPIPYIQLIG